MTPLVPPGPPPLRYRLFLWGWALLLGALMPLVWRYFSKRARKDPAYMAHAEERRGEGAPFDADVWVHAVSMGEMRSAEPLVRLCLDAGWRVVTTHATPAGRRAAEDLFEMAIADGQLAVRYAPVDRPAYWRAFLRGARPAVGLAMEMEFWPAMLEEARAAGVPLILANSQVPSKSYPRAQRVARVFGHPVARAAAVFAKSERMAERFRSLGASHVEALGETRFDIPPPAGQIEAGRALRNALGTRPVLTLASVVAGEEETYLAAIRDLLAMPEPPFVIWVPRAPELFGATHEMLARAGLSVAERSEMFDARLHLQQPLDGIDVLVGNSMGEMFFYLEPADAVIVGGGFVEKGAHNVIEPLALGKPVITGPRVWTIEFPGVEAREAGVLTVSEPGDLVENVRTALKGQSAGAEAFHAAHTGASRRIFERLAPLVEGRG